MIVPTCTEQGYTTYSCPHCGDSYTNDFTNALGHVMVAHGAVAATCTADGNAAYYTCSSGKCDGVYYANEIGTEVLTNIF